MIWLICRETHLNAIVDQETLNLQAAYRAPANEVSRCSLPLQFTESTLLHNLSFDKPSGILNCEALVILTNADPEMTEGGAGEGGRHSGHRVQALEIRVAPHQVFAS